MNQCNERYKEPNYNKCILKSGHAGNCQDAHGFKFYIEHFSKGEKQYWPNFLGNGPDGYPMNNKAFDAAAKKVLDDTRADYEKATRFMEEMARLSRKF